MFQLFLFCTHEAKVKVKTVVSHACCSSYPPKNAKVLCEFLTAEKNVRREKNKLFKFEKNKGNLKLYKDLIVRGFIKIRPPPPPHTLKSSRLLYIDIFPFCCICLLAILLSSVKLKLRNSEKGGTQNIDFCKPFIYLALNGGRPERS